MTVKQIFLPGTLRQEAIRWLPLLGLVAVAVWWYTSSGNAVPAALGPYSTGQVTNRIEGHSGPAVRSGEVVTFELEACSKDTVRVETVVSIHKLGNGPAAEARELISFITERDVACGPLQLTLLVSSSYGTGKFAIFGVDTVLGTGERLVWTTEAFDVIEHLGASTRMVACVHRSVSSILATGVVCNSEVLAALIAQ